MHDWLSHPSESAEARTLVEPSERPEWTRLAQQSGSIFATPEWLEIWWHHFGHGRRQIIERARDPSGRLLAILPLYVWTRGPLRVLRFVGHGPSDALGAICAPGDRHLAVRELRAAVDREQLDAFVGEDLADGEEWNVALGGELLRRHASPLLRIDGQSWAEFLASHRRATRQKIRAGERRVARAGLAYRLTSSREELGPDLDRLFELHRARFPRGTSDFGWDPRLEAFHREFAELALDRGWLRLWMLEKDGAAIAAHYGFSYANAHYGYNGGWDPGYAHVTPGRVLLLHALRSAFEERAGEFRFLRGDEPYKYWYANGDRPVDTIAVVKGVLPRVALDTYYNLWRLRRASAGRKVARARRKRHARRAILLTSQAIELVRSFFEHGT